MASRNVNLTDYLAQFVDQQVQSGRHQDASEVVREALRRYVGDLELENERIGAIRQVIQEGRDAIVSGAFRLVQNSDDEAELLARLTRRVTVSGAEGD